MAGNDGKCYPPPPPPRPGQWLASDGKWYLENAQMKRRREDLLGTKPSAIAEDDEAGIAHERRYADGE